MSRERALDPRDIRSVVEMNALRHLYDGVFREISHHTFAELLLIWPKIANVAATVDDDDTAPECTAHPAAVIIIEVCEIDDPRADLAKQPALAQPNCTIPNVGVSGIPNKCDPAPAWQNAPEAGQKRLLER